MIQVEDIFISFSILMILRGPIASFLWQFRRVRRRLSSPFKGIVLYTLSSAAPVVTYLTIFLALVGAEELLNTSLLGEGYARSLVIVAVGGAAWVVLGTVALCIAVTFTKS